MVATRNELTTIKELLMSTTAPGLTALQAFVTAFQNFVAQQSADLASLNTNITAAIAALGNSSASEDPAVQAAAASLTAALATVESNETSLETLNTSLGVAETGPAASSTVNGSVTSGSFMAGEKVVQATSGAIGVLAGVPPAGGPMTLTLVSGSAIPDATDVWTGQSSGAVFTPSGTSAAAAAIRAAAKKA